MRLGLTLTAMAAAGVTLVSCGGEELTQFQAGGARYAIPSQHVHAIRQEEPKFVRISDPETGIELVYDARAEGRTGPRGEPLLFSVNDEEYARITYWKTEEGALVVCHEGMAFPHVKCGAPLQDDDASWAILFPLERREEADQLRRRAKGLLELYRR